jgi:hypothetical protein
MNESRKARRQVTAEPLAEYLLAELGIEITARTILRYAGAGKIPFTRINDHYFFDVDEIRIWVLSNRGGPSVTSLLASSAEPGLQA